MTHQEILTKAIQKAIDGGWKSPVETSNWTEKEIENGSYANWLLELTDEYKIVIFNHDFAKALWGEGQMIDVEIHTNPFAMEDDQPDVVRTTEAWKLHLKNMVIAEDPIKYLEENIR